LYFLNKFKAKLYKQVLLQKNEYQIDLFDYSWLKNYSGSRDLQASKKAEEDSARLGYRLIFGKAGRYSLTVSLFCKGINKLFTSYWFLLLSASFSL